MNDREIPLLLQYSTEAPKDNENSPTAHTRCVDGPDIGWESWSLPIGNGYFGVNVFGRCECERIQITEKTLQNPPAFVKDGVTYFVGGLNSFSETYIDFGHKDILHYRRYLDLKTAIAGVEYSSGGVRYTREYFTSYPHKTLVIRLDADRSGALSFVLRPTIPYKQSYGGYEGDGVSKTGTVTSKVENDVGIAELSGSLDYYGIDFLGIYRVYTNGGKTEAITTEHTYRDKDGSMITDINGAIKVTGATSAYIVIALGSDYELSSDIFTSDELAKPTKFTSIEHTREKINSYLEKVDSDINGKSFDEAYEYLKNVHIEDHSALFGRVSLDLGDSKRDINLTTDELLKNYASGVHSNYLEALMFQYGRYLLIASSREGALPANLQGAWNTYNVPAWACGYWHNVNVQMNYWPAFSTNLAETFKAYDDYNAAYMEQAKKYADEVVKKYNPIFYGKDGGNGWVIGTDGYQFRITSDRSAGNLGFTTQLFWEQYAYTKNKEALKRAYELLVNAARYITKCVQQDENGNYLVAYCDSPEMHVDGVWYQTTGTAYAQAFAYINNYNALLAARDLGIDLSDEKLLENEEYAVLKTVMDQIDKYDPVQIGLSGQIKEFREEDYYCSIGDEYHHRHTSQLMGLYPANIINATTPAWLDGALVSLNERGDSGTGWGVALKLNMWARIKDGDRAYRLLNTLLKNNTANNLWTFHPPFQIDGNFGTTAGVSEMLLQSHEGYIAPLAALPSNWKAGSYTGLVARGNFEVSVYWENGIAKTFKITSMAGGAAKVYYPAIRYAAITSDDGSNIKFSIIEKDLISFETEIGKTYIITGFRAVKRITAPASLAISDANESALKLSWSAVGDAIGYNVYKAVESSPEYTLIGTTNDTALNYPIPTAEKNQRVTFAVTAISIDGYESSRRLCYKNPGISTEYGFIPSKNADIPFAIFENRNGKYRYLTSAESYTEATHILNESSSYDTDDTLSYVIYLTKNASVSKAETAKAFNSAIPRSDVLIDLAKRSLMLYSPLFTVDSSLECRSHVTLKNGKILTAGASVLEVFASNKEDLGKYGLQLSFNNVFFSREYYCRSTSPLFASENGGKACNTAITVTLDGCTIDYISSPETNKATLFDFSSENALFKAEIKGGIIKITSFNTLTVFEQDYYKNVVFTKNEEGNRTSLQLTDSYHPDAEFMTDSGKKLLKLVDKKKVHHTLYFNYTLSN